MAPNDFHSFWQTWYADHPMKPNVYVMYALVRFFNRFLLQIWTLPKVEHCSRKRKIHSPTSCVSRVCENCLGFVRHWEFFVRHFIEFNCSPFMFSSPHVILMQTIIFSDGCHRLARVRLGSDSPRNQRCGTVGWWWCSTHQASWCPLYGAVSSAKTARLGGLRLPSSLRRGTGSMEATQVSTVRIPPPAVNNDSSLRTESSYTLHFATIASLTLIFHFCADQKPLPDNYWIQPLIISISSYQVSL